MQIQTRFSYNNRSSNSNQKIKPELLNLSLNKVKINLCATYAKENLIIKRL